MTQQISGFKRLTGFVADLLFPHQWSSGRIAGFPVAIVPHEDVVIVVAELLHLDRLLRVGRNQLHLLQLVVAGRHRRVKMSKRDSSCIKD